MNTNIKSREAKLRRTLKKSGHTLLKGPPANSFARKYYGPGYMIARDQTVVLGCIGRAYSASLEKAESMAADL